MIKYNTAPQKYTSKLADTYYGNKVTIIGVKSVLTRRLKKPVLYTLSRDVITTKSPLAVHAQ